MLFQVRFLWLEDMYVTGVLAESAGLNYINNGRNHWIQYSRSRRAMRQIEKQTNIFLLGHVPIADAYKYWANVQKFIVREV